MKGCCGSKLCCELCCEVTPEECLEPTTGPQGCNELADWHQPERKHTTSSQSFQGLFQRLILQVELPTLTKAMPGDPPPPFLSFLFSRMEDPGGPVTMSRITFRSHLETSSQFWRTGNPIYNPKGLRTR